MSGHTMMQLVQRALRKWLPHMERMAYSKMEFTGGGEDGFSIIASWKESKAGPAGSHTILFTRQRVLGHTASLGPSHQRPVHKICRFRDDVVREVLEIRKGKR